MATCSGSCLSSVTREFSSCMTWALDPRRRVRTDCLRGLRRIYGVRFRRFAGVDPIERHDVLRRPDDAVSIVYATDPQNRRANIVLLDDDRGMFPPYNSTFVVR